MENKIKYHMYISNYLRESVNLIGDLCNWIYNEKEYMQDMFQFKVMKLQTSKKLKLEFKNKTKKK